MTKLFWALLLASSLSYAQADTLQQAIDSPHRPVAHKARDVYRHPQQTLAFFGLEDTMTVVEVWPGEGWYTEILAPWLKGKGVFYAAHYSPEALEPYHQKGVASFVKKLRQQPELYGEVKLTALEPPTHLQIAPNGSADRVLTFRNVHNWMRDGQAAAVFGAMYQALKPGGILGVVEHRASPLKPQDPKGDSGYVSEDYVIALARKAGFEFLAKSEINANSKDTKDYPGGVWVLPPALALGEQDRAKYLAIGESDRMTLKFIKPK